MAPQTRLSNVTKFGLCGGPTQSASEPFMYHKALVPAGSCVLVTALPFAQTPVFACVTAAVRPTAWYQDCLKALLCLVRTSHAGSLLERLMLLRGTQPALRVADVVNTSPEASPCSFQGENRKNMK